MSISQSEINEIMENSQKEMQRQRKLYERKLKQEKKKVHEIMPDTFELRENNLIFVREKGYSGYGLARKDVLDFTHFDKNGQIFPIKEGTETKNVECYIIIYFNMLGQCVNIGTMTRRYKALITMHSELKSSCLGNAKHIIININKKIGQENGKPYGHIHKAMDDYKELLKVLNPDSPLRGINEITNLRLKETAKWVDKQYRRWNDEEESDMHECINCGSDFDYPDGYDDFCSQECHDEYNDINHCTYCEKRYNITDSNAHEVNTYCSMNCEREAQKETQMARERREEVDREAEKLRQQRQSHDEAELASLMRQGQRVVENNQGEL